MTSYPVILIPITLQKVFPLAWPAPDRPKPQPPVLPPVPSPPTPPGPEPQPVNKKELLQQTLGLILFCLLALLGLSAFLPLSAGLSIVAFTFLASAGALALLTWGEQKSFPRRLKDYQKELRQYERQCDSYVKAKAEFSKKSGEFKQKQYQYKIDLKAWHEKKDERDAKIASERDRLRRASSPISPPDGNSSRAQRGYLEPNFENSLWQYFPGKIHTGLTCAIPNCIYSYTPDFAYIYPELNLYIDIEIDEPYVYQTENPLHFLGCHKDKQRNEFFVNRGWIIIRFAEEQVARWPHSCCKEVAKQVSQLTGDPMPEQLAKASDLPRVRQWTETEAKRMAARKERDIYLR